MTGPGPGPYPPGLPAAHLMTAGTAQPVAGADGMTTPAGNHPLPAAAARRTRRPIRLRNAQGARSGGTGRGGRHRGVG